jgi:hypothetical protein
MTVLRTILQEILEITTKNPIFRDVTKEAINSELNIWCTKWQRHKLEGNDFLITS